MTTSNNNPEPPIYPAPLANLHKPSFTLPPDATDSHAHVFGARAQYGYDDARQYTPPPVYLKDYLAMHDTVGFARGVVVQSGVHGTNNQVIVDAIAQSNGRLRGIALLREDITDAELDALDKAGVCGFRANLVAKVGVKFEAAKKLAARVARLGWHAQFLLDIENFPDLDRIAADFPSEMMIDHMGRPDPTPGRERARLSGVDSCAAQRACVVEVISALPHVAHADSLRRSHAFRTSAGCRCAGSAGVRH